MRTILFISILLAFSCASVPKQAINNDVNDEMIDYSKLSFWAAHPEKQDAADYIPGSVLTAQQEDLKVDVFFLHPTTFTGGRGENQWNADLWNEALNQKTDEGTIRFQATIFNQAGRVYAPRYRQAHLSAFYTRDKKAAKRAFDLAYEDIRSAFEYYLHHENEGRPIIIAAHSQGTYHGARLVKEYFDNTTLMDRLVVAYLVGMPVVRDYFEAIRPCEDSSQTSCFCSWRTFRKDHIPERIPMGDSIIVTNPLNWSTSSEYAGKDLNKGAVLRNFDKVYDNLVDAYVYDGMLWVSRPKFPWSFLFTRKNYHIADYNFFYYNVQENAKERVKAFID